MPSIPRERAPSRTHDAPRPVSVSAGGSSDGSPEPLRPRPLLRDPWALACVAAVLVLVARAWGAPLGEPVAEDFDFLQRALFGPFTLLDGGGSTVFWRPISHQLYYLACARLMLGAPAVLAGLHVGVLALATLLLYRAFATARPGLRAAIVATAPLFSESTRMMIAWPSDFVDLGVWLFVALAAHETARRRMPSALVALGAALLCKEVAVIAAVLLPLLPGIGPRDDRARLRWLAAFVALVAVWGIAYLAVRQHAHLSLPHHLEQTLATATWWDRLGWALANSLRAAVSLPPAEAAYDRAVGSLLALLLFLGAAIALRSGTQRSRWRAARPWVLWGVAWFLASSAALIVVYPYWSPVRAAFGALGLVVVAAEIAWMIHPALLVGLVVVRLVAFAFAPAPPTRIAWVAPATGAFVDFERLTRLQHLMRSTRLALMARVPRATPGMRIGTTSPPQSAEYAFGGSHAIRAWYRDPTLEWVPFERVRAHPDSGLAAIVEFEPDGPRPVAIVETQAMRAYLSALERARAGDPRVARELLDRAAALQLDDAALVFRKRVARERRSLVRLSSPAEPARFMNRPAVINRRDVAPARARTAP